MLEVFENLSSAEQAKRISNICRSPAISTRHTVISGLGEGAILMVETPTGNTLFVEVTSPLYSSAYVVRSFVQVGDSSPQISYVGEVQISHTLRVGKPFEYGGTFTRGVTKLTIFNVRS